MTLYSCLFTFDTEMEILHFTNCHKNYSMQRVYDIKCDRRKTSKRQLLVCGLRTVCHHRVLPWKDINTTKFSISYGTLVKVLFRWVIEWF